MRKRKADYPVQLVDIHRWLADCALVWLETIADTKYNETPVKVTRANGEQLELSSVVKDVLKDGDFIFVYLKEDVEFMDMGR